MAITSADVSRLRMELKLTHGELADFLDVKEVTIKSWESGATKIHGTPAKIVTCFIAFSKQHPHLFPDLRDRVKHSLSGHGFAELLGSLLETYAGLNGRAS